MVLWEVGSGSLLFPALFKSSDSHLSRPICYRTAQQIQFFLQTFNRLAQVGACGSVRLSQHSRRFQLSGQPAPDEQSPGSRLFFS